MNTAIDYHPLPSQARFHSDPARIKLFSGGVGSGKTRAGCIEALALAIENPGSDGMIVAPTWSILQRVTLRGFMQVLPKDLIKSEHRQQRRIDLVNGSVIWYGSTSDVSTLEGTSLAWFYSDESRFSSLESFNILLARLRCPKARRHVGILTSTPSMGWLFDQFGKPRKGRGLTIASTSENLHLSTDFIQDLKNTYSDSLYASYVDGQFVQLTGGVFPQFDLNKHVKDLVVHRDPVHVAIDFGYRKPAALYFQFFPWCKEHAAENCIHVLDQDMPSNTSTRELSKRCLQHYARRGWQRGIAYVDPAGAAKNPVIGWSDIDMLEQDHFEVEYTYDPVQRWIPTGIEAIRRKLRNMAGNTSLYFHRRLMDDDRGIIRAIQLAEYPENRGGELKEKPIKDGIYDHALDALRYAVVNLDPMQ